MNKRSLVGRLFVCAACPALGQHQFIDPEGASTDHFGVSVAISGDAVIIGSPHDDVGSTTDQGSACVYRWTGAEWALEAKLVDGGGRGMGFSVAMSGDTAILGAISYPASVFTRTGTTWTLQARLGNLGTIRSYSVAVSGDTALIGDRNFSVATGTAYVYTRSNGEWTRQARLSIPNAAENDWFGYSVALSGDTALVGAPQRDFGPSINQGAAYVFVRQGSVWSLQAELVGSDNDSLDLFGTSVALFEDTALIGAPQRRVGQNANQGAAYAFGRSGTTWSQQEKIVGSDGREDDQFGNAVSLRGSTALIGCQYRDVLATTDQGAAYFYTRSGSAWTLLQRLVAPAGESVDDFGYSVCLSDDAALIGAPSDDVNGVANCGSAWLFSNLLCRADFNNDGFVSGIDFDLFVYAFEAGDASADFDQNDAVNGLDFDLFVQSLEAGC